MCQNEVRKRNDKDSNTNDTEAWNEALKSRIHQLEDAGTFTKQNHTDLNDLVVIDSLTLERAIPNHNDTIKIENDYLSGQACTMVRTFSPTKGGTPSHLQTCQHFNGKKRNFEIQFQFQFKKVPSANQKLFLACELDHAIQLSKLQRTVLTCIMKFVKKRNVGFYYNLTGNGADEKPHISFLLETCCTLLLITKPNETPPTLGGTLPREDTDSKIQRKKGFSQIQWNTSDIYTIGIWSSYANICTWECLGIPAIPKFPLTNILGTQVFHVGMYLADIRLKRHCQSDLYRLLSFEFGHYHKTRIGPFTRKWLEKFGILQDTTEQIVQKEQSSNTANSNNVSNGNTTRIIATTLMTGSFTMDDQFTTNTSKERMSTTCSQLQSKIMWRRMFLLILIFPLIGLFII